MKLFTIGPAQMYREVLEAKSEMVPYFRTQSYSEQMLFVREMLIRSMNAEKDCETMFLTCSGTGAMEATLINCFSSKDNLFIINGGTFGKRFCRLSEIHHIPYESIDLKFGEVLTEDRLEKYENENFTAMLVNLHETSTGQLYDIKLLSDFCKRNNMFLAVDAISTFLCDEYDMQKYSIDATIISSQKGLCCSPGISFVVLSSRLNDYRKKQGSVECSYFDFSDYILDMKRGQTPYTPAVGVFLEVYAMFKKIEKEGVESLLSGVRDNAEYFRSNISGLSVRIPDYPLSYAITPLIFDQAVARTLFTYLFSQKDIYVNPCGGDMADRMIRVAHIGDLSVDDHRLLIECMSEFLSSNRI